MEFLNLIMFIPPSLPFSVRLLNGSNGNSLTCNLICSFRRNMD